MKPWNGNFKPTVMERLIINASISWVNEKKNSFRFIIIKIQCFFVNSKLNQIVFIEFSEFLDIFFIFLLVNLKLFILRKNYKYRSYCFFFRFCVEFPIYICYTFVAYYILYFPLYFIYNKFVL